MIIICVIDVMLIYFALLQVPFLSIGEEICLREVREQVKSSMSGDIAVEDVSVNGTMYRRLVFLKTKHILQSEVRLVQG